MAVWTAIDGLLAAIAPLGLAASAGTALCVDLDTDGPTYPGEKSLCDLLDQGIRRSDLVPERSGLAVLRNGGADPGQAWDLISMLAEHWPAIVVRVPTQNAQCAVIPVIPIFPGLLQIAFETPAVYQPTGYGAEFGEGLVLPKLKRGVVSQLLNGVAPIRSKWIEAWRPVWEMPWT